MPARCPRRLSTSCAPPALLGDLDDDVPADHRLTPQPGVQRQPFRRIQAILLVLLHRREVLLSLPDHHVAGRAGAAPAAVMLEVDIVGQRDVEHRPGLAVIGQRILAVVHLDRHVLRQEGQLVHRHHFFSRISSARRDVTARLIAASLPVRSSLAWTCRMPLASMRKVTSIFGMPAGMGSIPARSNRARERSSFASSRSPCTTCMSTAVCPSTEVVKYSFAMVGMVVFRGISTLTMPPSVSIPRLSGVTSSSSISVMPPARIWA